MKTITEHGVAMYRYRRCRCETCRAAVRIQKRKYRPKNDNKNIKLDGRALYDYLQRHGRLPAVSRKSMSVWLKNGINIYVADEVCSAIGVHPVEVWGHAFYAGCFDEGNWYE